MREVAVSNVHCLMRFVCAFLLSSEKRMGFVTSCRTCTKPYVLFRIPFVVRVHKESHDNHNHISGDSQKKNCVCVCRESCTMMISSISY